MRQHPVLIATATAVALVLAACSSGASDTSGDQAPQGTSTSTASQPSQSSDSTPSDTGTSAGSADGTDGVTPGGTITTRLKADAGTLDPALSTVGGQVIDTYLYDPLVHIAPDGTVVSGIAEKWDVGADSATFTIRDDVTCSDGHALTASDVKANYDHLKDPDTHATWIVSNMSTTDYTVTADDAARTVTITLPQAYGDLISGIASIGIVCPSGLKDPSSLTAGSAGTGPFVLESATPDVEYRLKARDGYQWGPDGATNAVDGYPTEIVWKVVKDDATAVNMFTRGELNLLPMAGAEATRLSNDPSVTNSDTVTSTGWYMIFNQLPNRPLAGKQKVREALAKATNRRDLIQVDTGGLGEVINTLVTTKPTTCDDSAAASSVPTYDVAAAQQLLDEAGWTVGADGIREKDGHKLSLVLMAYPATDAVSEYLQQSWSTQLGINVKLESLDDNTAGDRLFKGGDWDVSMLRIATTLHSTWTQFLMGAQPPDGQNFGSGNKTYQDLATQAQSTPGQAGCDLWVKAEESAFTALDVFPLYVPQGLWFAHNVTFTAVTDAQVLPLSLRTVG